MQEKQQAYPGSGDTLLWTLVHAQTPAYTVTVNSIDNWQPERGGVISFKRAAEWMLTGTSRQWRCCTNWSPFFSAWRTLLEMRAAGGHYACGTVL